MMHNLAKALLCSNFFNLYFQEQHQLLLSLHPTGRFVLPKVIRLKNLHTMQWYRVKRTCALFILSTSRQENLLTCFSSCDEIHNSHNTAALFKGKQWREPNEWSLISTWSLIFDLYWSLLGFLDSVSIHWLGQFLHELNQCQCILRYRTGQTISSLPWT